MKNDKNRFPITNIGSVSLLMIFIVLCMIIIAALSLTDAARDYNFSARMAEHNKEYYTASNNAEAIIKQIKETKNFTDFSGVFLTDLRIEDFTVTPEEDSTIVSYNAKMNDSQALHVELEIAGDDAGRGESDSAVSVRAWREIQTREWHGDNSLHLVQP